MQYPDVGDQELPSGTLLSIQHSLDDINFPLPNNTFKRNVDLLIRALDTSVCGIVLTDNCQPDNPIIYCNTAFEKISGYSTKETIGRNCRFLQGQDCDQQARQVIRQAVFNGESCHLEIRNYRKDGTLFWNELFLSPVKDEQGKVTHFIGVQNDISAKKQAELALLRHQQTMEKQIQERTAELRASEEYLASIVSTVRESLVVLDGSHQILSVNDHFLKTFKVSLDETQGKGLHELGNGQWNIGKLKTLLEEVLPTGDPVENFEVEHDFPQIGRKLMLVNAHRIELEGQYKNRILIAIQNITEQREIEKRKDDFLSIASHELKTPLTTVKGYMQLLKRFTLNNPDEKLTGIVHKTNLYINRLDELITELLDVSRIQTGNLKLHREPFDFDKMISEVVDGLQAATSTHRIEVLGSAVNWYVGDESHLVQVISNLLANAIKYAPDTDLITVHLSLAGSYLKVSVKDYGIGITPEDQKKIFERFFRVSGIQYRFPGMGIGLYICEQIIANHSGNLWVESEPGEGSTFSFTLPLNEA